MYRSNKTLSRASFMTPHTTPSDNSTASAPAEAPVVPRAAATVVMLRDGADGLEVFMVRRHGMSDVLGGSYVFPGGKVDADDATLRPEDSLDQTPDTLHASLGEPALDAVQATAIYVAAVREAVEECGVLFAQPARGPDVPVDVAQFAALCRAGHSFNQAVGALGLRLHTHALAPWSRWITPAKSPVMTKRFDTRFFLAAAPAGQTAVHDDHEATASVWTTPQAALARYESKEIDLIPPQIMGLLHLAHYRSVQAAMQDARAHRPPVIRPEVVNIGNGDKLMCYPGDELHPVRERALPGPSRIVYRSGRFEWK